MIDFKLQKGHGFDAGDPRSNNRRGLKPPPNSSSRLKPTENTTG